MSLFEPGRIGDLTVPNRAVFRPVRTGFAEGGVPTPETGLELVEDCTLEVVTRDHYPGARASDPAALTERLANALDDRLEE
jgi:hypothetical protein